MFSLINKLIRNLSSEPYENLEFALKRLSEEAMADECFIATEDNGYYRIIVKSGEPEVEVLSCIFDYVCRDKQGVTVTEKSQLPESLCAVMCIPLIAGQKDGVYKEEKRKKTNGYRKIVAYICFQKRKGEHAFTQSFIDKFEYISGLLVNCLELHQTRLMAGTDKLTGALNRKYIDMALETYFDKAKHNGGKFSIIMADLDFFKHVNDTYGHLVGDDVLRNTSEIIRANLKKGDVLGRYGGEEFIVLLSEADGSKALDEGENLRCKIHAAKILGDKREITISLGIASYPEHADSVKALVEKADKALYMAKQTGRNNCKLWDDSFNEYLVTKNIKEEFFSGDAAKDANKILALYEIMDITQFNYGLTEKINLTLNKIKNVLNASDIILFLTENENITNRFQIKSPGRGTIRHNNKIIRKVIDTKKPIYLVDWDNYKTDDTTGLTDWQSIMVTPAICGGVLRGVIYAAVSLKSKEFKAEEMSFIYNVATIVATMIQ